MGWWPRRRRETFDSAPRPIDQMFLEMLGRAGHRVAVTRTSALSVPAVLRGRDMICSLATLPLLQHDATNAVAPSALLAQLDPDVPNVVTLAQTLDDLLFSAVSWWQVTARDFAGYPQAVRHLDVGSVSVNPPTGRNPAPLPSGIDPRQAVLYVDGRPVPASTVIRFDGPNPALLEVAADPIRRAILLSRAASMYADDPRPLDYFTPADGADPLDDDETLALMAKWKAARKERSTAYVPASLNYHTVDAPSPQELQLVELGRQASLDIANALGVDPEDVGVSTTSRTYANDVDRRRNKLNDVLAPYMRAITDRLSMGDVTRRGYTVRFSTAEYLQPNPTDRWGVYSTAVAMGAMTLDEVRAAEGLPPLPAAPDAPAEPDPEPEEEPVPDPVPAAESDAPAQHTFDGAETFTMDVPVTEFSVDRDNRIIEGLAVPYGAVGRKGGMQFRFSPGSMTWNPEHPGRVKLVYPRHGSAVGTAIQLRNTRGGLLARFKVGRSPEGDQALMDAEDGVYDGLSVGVDFDAATDATPDPKDRNVMLVRRADLRHVALTDEPVFDDARVTRVAASRDTGGGHVADTDPEPVTAPAPTPAPAAPEPVARVFSADEVAAMLASVGHTAAPAPEPERPAVVNPVRPVSFSVEESTPYTFDRAGHFAPGQYDFSTDVVEMLKRGDIDGTGTDAGRRVMGLLRAAFDVDSADINELTPTIQRPDMYVDQRDYRTPLWDMVSKGAPPNGIQPFTFPKFNAASGLVGDHTEGTEPTSGTMTSTGQTVTPTAISGKVSITREVWDMGGNPAVSTLVFNQMVRGYREGLESATATFLATLTAATDIALTAAGADEALAGEWDAALAGLQFVRGYDFSAFAMEQVLYKAFVAARDDAGRVLYPIIAPMNANGTAQARFRTLDLGGVTGVPSWALASTPGSVNSSWLFDPSVIHGWATAPQRLEFPGTDSSGGYAPVAMIDLAIWGYKAFANSDIAGVRQVTYDSVA